jgi:hypothetical protein
VRGPGARRPQRLALAAPHHDSFRSGANAGATAASCNRARSSASAAAGCAAAKSCARRHGRAAARNAGADDNSAAGRRGARDGAAIDIAGADRAAPDLRR